MDTAHKIISEINASRRQALSKTDEELLHHIMITGSQMIWELRRELLSHQSRSAVHVRLRRLVDRGVLGRYKIRKMGNLGLGLSRPYLKRYLELCGLSYPTTKHLILSADCEDMYLRRFAAVLNQRVSVDWITYASQHARNLKHQETEFQTRPVPGPGLLLKLSGPGIHSKIAVDIKFAYKSRYSLTPELGNRMVSREWNKVIYLLGPAPKIRDYLDRIQHLKVTSPHISGRKKTNPILFLPHNDFLESELNAKGTTENGEVTLEEFLKK